MPLAETILKPFGSKSFFAGLFLIVAFYACAFLYAYLTSSSYLQDAGAKLASITVNIQREAFIEPQDEIVEAATDLGAPPVAEETAIQSTPENTSAAVDAQAVDAPYPGLFETLPNGDLLPKIAEDGTTPFNAYSAPFAVNNSKKLIALVIDDTGLSPSMTDILHRELPKEATFLVSAYASKPDELQKKLRPNGRELWLKVPFETAQFPQDDPGMRAILSRASLGSNMENFKWALSRFSGYSGIAVDMDNAFTKARPTIGALMKESFDRGLGYFEINNSASPQVKDMAERMDAPYIRNEIKLHDPKWNGNITEAGELLENIAESKGFAIGVLKPYPDTPRFLKEWIASLTARNYVLVPLSSIYKRTKPELATSPSSVIQNDQL